MIQNELFMIFSGGVTSILVFTIIILIFYRNKLSLYPFTKQFIFICSILLIQNSFNLKLQILQISDTALSAFWSDFAVENGFSISRLFIFLIPAIAFNIINLSNIFDREIRPSRNATLSISIISQLISMVFLVDCLTDSIAYHIVSTAVYALLVELFIIKSMLHYYNEYHTINKQAIVNSTEIIEEIELNPDKNDVVIEDTANIAKDNFSIKKDLKNKLYKLLEEKQLYLSPDITLEKMANECATNRTYLSYYFNKELNTSFNQFINSYRIQKSAIPLLLSEEESSLYNVAVMSGFNSYSTFLRAFMDETGMKPSLYIIKHKDN